ncbi:(2Fe-2S) ferredoxin domain-containing protein [Dethiothermospora halolimnae]|uniref:(2Fe-2S) ferredoxin domain-containing protein n=1 Tax=Dethiothermospora halolimnae TaxID=3114390 RepID=UPI003CCB8A26
MKSLEELKKIREASLDKVTLRNKKGGTRIVVGMATCGISAGARPVLMALLEETKKRNLENVTVTQTGCIGICDLEPIVEVFSPDREKVTYVNMTEDKARKIILEHIVNGNVVTDYTIGTIRG